MDGHVHGVVVDRGGWMTFLDFGLADADPKGNVAWAGRFERLLAEVEEKFEAAPAEQRRQLMSTFSRNLKMAEGG